MSELNTAIGVITTTVKPDEATQPKKGVRPHTSVTISVAIKDA